MKIVIASDLHVDGNRIPLPDISGDVLMVAGDTSNSPKITAKTINKLAGNFNKVFFTDGNHEGYHNTEAKRTLSDSTAQLLDKVTADNATYLNVGTSEIYNGFKFIGCNGWYSMDWGNTDPDRWIDLQHWATYMSDYRQVFKHEYETSIQQGHNCLLPRDLAKIHTKWLFDQIMEAETHCIVMTHTLPHEKFLFHKHHDPIWQSLHAYFVNLFTQAMWEAAGEKVALWQFGHTHYSQDTVLNKTRFIANPRGYYSENPNWNWIEVDLDELC